NCLVQDGDTLYITHRREYGFHHVGDSESRRAFETQWQPTFWGRKHCRIGCSTNEFQFVESTPDFFSCPENQDRIGRYMDTYKLSMTLVLALIAIPALVRNAARARLLVWVFNVEGTLDLSSAITLATIYRAQPYMGAAYWIPAFWVPGLLVTHYITFVFLW